MNAKAIDLAVLAALSVLCAMIAWQSDRDVVGSLFFALGAVAMIGAGVHPAAPLKANPK